jgi:hypothetical protein
VLVDVARGRRPPERLPQLAQQAEQLLARGEAARDEAGEPLRAVPAAEVLDHGLRVHRRLRIGGELAHRRRAAQPHGAGGELAQDLIVGIPLADPSLEIGERLAVDVGDRAVDGLSRHLQPE